jgi:TetR/AcrR family transcriptional regulator, mexJK operon transcriptional repressor
VTGPIKTARAKLDHQARILDAASAAFLENGFEFTSTADIAQLARVSKRELYACFADKRAILAAVIARLQQEIQSQVNLSWSSSEDIGKVLTMAGTEILNFISSEKFGKLFRIVAAETFRDPVSAEKFYLLGPGMGRENTAAFLKRRMASGDLRKADPLQAADDFLDLIISARYLTAIVLGQNREVLLTRKHVKHAVEMFLGYYASPAPASVSGRKERPGGNRVPRTTVLEQ